MSVVLVTGGTGTLGRHLAPILVDRGHDVRVLSRRPGSGTHAGDLSSGVGVVAAADGADLVVHAATDTRRGGREDEAQTERLLTACRDAQHVLYPSIVGLQSVPLPYYRRKLRCEQLIGTGPVPHTILRATQFHELLARLLRRATALPVLPVPAGWLLQTVAAYDVAVRAADLLEQNPRGHTHHFGGPEILRLEEMLDAWRRSSGRPRAAIAVPVPGRAGRALRHGGLTCADCEHGSLTWDEHCRALHLG